MVFIFGGPVNNVGYHINFIPKGINGETSKILEEVLELQDAEQQGSVIMELNELSDIIGAIQLYLNKKHPTIKLNDLILMSKITHRAFESGHRQ